MCQCANEEKFADGVQPISILAHYHIDFFPKYNYLCLNKQRKDDKSWFIIGYAWLLG